MSEQQKALAADALGRLQTLMGESGLNLDDIRQRGMVLNTVPGGDAADVNETYRAALSGGPGRAMLVDMVVRFCIGGTYTPGGDSSAAVFDAGMRAVVSEMIWRATQEVSDA